MSVSNTIEQIKFFLHSSQPEVIAIKGKWGTGKTYLWNKCLLEEAETNSIALLQYSYISLFGTNSIEQLKDKLSESLTLIPSKTNKKPHYILGDIAAKYTKKSASLISSAIDTCLAKYNFKVNILPILKNLLFQSITESIIIIDDMERKKSTLQSDEVFGLISYLKEQRKCKVVLIYNEDELDKSDKDMYKKLREKIIDKELTLTPTPDECASIVFSDDPIDIKIKQFSIRLKIRNIRILQKIKNLSNDMLKVISSYPDDIKYTALHSLVLYVYCFYSLQPDLPSIETLETLRFGYSFIDNTDEKNIKKTAKVGESTDKAPWITTLQDYDYTDTDEFDRIILAGIKQGYFDSNALIIQADLLTSELSKNQAKDSFLESWDTYHNQLGNDQDLVVESIYASFKTNMAYLSVSELNSTLIFFRQLGESQKADELLHSFISLNTTNPEKLDPEHLMMFPGTERDSELMQKLKTIQGNTKRQASLEQTFQSINDRSSWSTEESMILNDASEDDLYNLIIHSTDSNLRAIIKYGLMLIPDKTRAVLSKISKESKINQLRLARYLA